jgi:hypothetical protein
MKKILTMIMILFTLNASSDVQVMFDDMGKFIPPDMILQARGLDYYEGGYLDSALMNFKESAEFGNERSKYLIALMHFQNKDWATGYAWLNLLKTSVENRDKLLKKIKPMLSNIELTHSENILKQLKSEYNDITSFNRRNKWDKSFKGTGTKISGIRAATLRNASMDMGGYGNITPQMIRKQIYENYIVEYEPKGQVILGDIVEASESQ